MFFISIKLFIISITISCIYNYDNIIDNEISDNLYRSSISCTRNEYLSLACTDIFFREILSEVDKRKFISHGCKVNKLCDRKDIIGTCNDLNIPEYLKIDIEKLKNRLIKSSSIFYSFNESNKINLYKIEGINKKSLLSNEINNEIYSFNRMIFCDKWVPYEYGWLFNIRSTIIKSIIDHKQKLNLIENGLFGIDEIGSYLFNEKYKRLLTPLMASIYANNEESFNYLIDNNVNINRKGSIEWIHPIYIAIYNNINDMFDKLIEYNIILETDYLINNLNKIKILYLKEILSPGRNITFTEYLNESDGNIFHQYIDLYSNEINDGFMPNDVLSLIIDRDFFDLNHKDKYSNTPLHRAVINNNYEFSNILVKKGVEIYSFNNDNKNALDIAIDNDNNKIIKLLSSIKNESINNLDNEGLNSLHKLSKNNNFLDLEKIIKIDSININEKDHKGNTALSIAAYLGHKNIVNILLKSSKINIISRNHNGKIALHRAIINNYIDIVKLLVSKNNNIVNIQDSEGNTALHLASSLDLIDIVDFLLKENIIDANIVDINNQTALSLATYAGNIRVIRSFVDNVNYETLNNKGEKGYSVLHISVLNKNLKLVKLIISLNEHFNLNPKDNNGYTPLHLAAFTNGYIVPENNIIDDERKIKDIDNQKNIINAFCDSIDVNINVQDLDGRTPLHHAVINKIKDNIEILLRCKDIDVDIKDYKGNRAIDLVEENIEIKALFSEMDT